ncbi:MAG: phosphotransferase family protein [Candidatus Sericytochromatia bacterium]
MNPFAQPETTQVWLETTCHAPITELTYLTRGWNTRIFSFVCRGQQLVLRVASGPEQIYKEALAAQRYGHGLPIPRVWAAGQEIEQDLEVEQMWHWAIVSRCEGQSLDMLSALAQKSLEPAILVLHLDLLAQPLFLRGAGSLNVIPPHAPIFGGWRASLSHLGGMASRLGGLLQAPIGFLPNELDALLARLQVQIGLCPEMPLWLIHGDFKPANIIVNHAGEIIVNHAGEIIVKHPKNSGPISEPITGLIDWAGLGQGDFLFDTATWIWHQPEAQWASIWQNWAPAYRALGLDLSHAPARLEAYLLFGALQAGITLAGSPALSAEIPLWRQRLRFLQSASVTELFQLSSE